MTTSSTGAFAAPALFEVLLDRVASDVYPSERLALSAALSARTTDQLDQLLRVLGRQQIGHYLSPRRLQLLGMVAQRRRLLRPASAAIQELVDPDESVADIDNEELRSAVELLEQTQALLD